MVDVLTLLAFAPAALALNLTPGADMMFCLGLGLRGTARSSIAASAGISTGSMVHVTAAGLGLSALVAAAPWAFDVIRWIGVAYLVWLAVQILRSGTTKATTGTKLTSVQAFRSGFLVNILNPKIVLFALAFIPQFVDPASSVLGQFLIFGSILAVGGFFINGAIGVFAAQAGQHLAKGGRVLDWICSGIFAGLAVRLAVLERA